MPNGVSLYQLGQGKSDSHGNVSISFPVPGMNRTWLGSLQFLNAPAATQWTLTIGGLPYATIYSPGPAGPFQILSGQQILLTATGLTASTVYQAILSGVDEPADRATTYVGPTSVTSINVGAGGGIAITPVSGQWFPAERTIGAGSINMITGYLCFRPLLVFTSHSYNAIGLWVNTIGSGVTVRFGIYPDNSGSPYNSTLIVDSGPLSITGSPGGFSLPITVTLTTGVYWLVGVQNAAATPAAANGLNMTGAQAQDLLVVGADSLNALGALGPFADYAGYISSAGTYTGALPSTCPAVVLNQGHIYDVRVKAS